VAVTVTNPLTHVQRSGPDTLVGGRYRLKSSIGTGGMGTVWRATDTQLGRDVAVKEVVPAAGLAAEERDALYERMKREARAAARLSHPGIVQVYDVVEDDGRPWVVMELLDARSLSDLVMEDGPLAPRAVAKIGVALLGALEVAHAVGILHRDVKPANVLVCSDGRCVLTDFGVARLPTDQRLTTPGMVLGSPHFISPERAMGRPFGPASDLFSVGVTLYIAVEGVPPFDRGEPIATMHSVVEDPPQPPHRAGPLAEVIYGLLEKDPNLRWDTARARQALRELLAGPLASKAPMFSTDPYAVVPSQRQPIPEPQNTPNRIGGRALLAPDELPTDRIPPDPYRALPDSYQDTTASFPQDSTARLNGTRHRAARRRLRLRDRRAYVGIAAGLAVLLTIGLAWALTSRDGGGDPAAPPPQAAPPQQGGPPFEVETYQGRGVSINVPAGWQYDDNDARVYVDFVHPSDSDTQVRLLVESPWNAAAEDLLRIAERNIQANGCQPYQRIGEYTEIEVAGEPAMQMEYRCDDGDDLRRARWATLVHDGVAYSFRLTARDGEFDQHEPIFDELLRSFRLANA
jgi:serine/threonine protein kinase